MGLKRPFPTMRGGAEVLKIVCDAVERYSIECKKRFTPMGISRFIMRTREVYISPSTVKNVLNRLKFVERIAPFTYVLREKYK